MLDLTAWFLGEPANITCSTWAPKGYDAELQAHALFKMRSGATVHFEAAVSRFKKTGIYENGWEESIRIDGTDGRIELDFPLWNRSIEAAARARIYRNSTQAWEEFPHQMVDPFQVEIEAFERACRGHSGNIPGLREGVLVDLWIDACYQSANTGEQVAFPLF